MQFGRFRNTYDDGNNRRLDTRRRRRGDAKLIGSKASRGITRRGSILNLDSSDPFKLLCGYNRQGKERREILEEVAHGATFAGVAADAVSNGHHSWALPRKERPRRLVSVKLVALPPRKPAAVEPVPFITMESPPRVTSSSRIAHLRTSCGWMGDLGCCQKRLR